MEFRELIKQVLLQMYKSCLSDKTELERLDISVMKAIGKESDKGEKDGACANSSCSAVRE